MTGGCSTIITRMHAYIHSSHSSPSPEAGEEMARNRDVLAWSQVSSRRRSLLCVFFVVAVLIAHEAAAQSNSDYTGYERQRWEIRKTPFRRPLQLRRSFNIAHRGSNGILPEETREAYELAIKEGADFIETDVMATKDGQLICFHDVTLDELTDVTTHSAFADRNHTYEVQGVNVTGFFAVDFTLSEIKTLRVNQRWPDRDQSFNGKYEIITFEEFIQIALNANRVVGIYPEMKNPVFLNQRVQWPRGMVFEDAFLERLRNYGYGGKYLSKEWKKQPIFIQSFAPLSLIYISNFTTSPKILLIDDVPIPTQDTNQTFWEITSNEYFGFISKYVVGIGPWKENILPSTPDNHLGHKSDMIERAHHYGLQVHPYTYRNENNLLNLDFHLDPYQEYEFWIHTMNADGLFTDFTGSLHRYQQWTCRVN